MYQELKAGSYFLNNSTKSPLTGKFVPVQSLKTEDSVGILSGTIDFSGARRPTGNPFSRGFPVGRLPFEYSCHGVCHRQAFIHGKLFLWHFSVCPPLGGMDWEVCDVERWDA